MKLSTIVTALSVALVLSSCSKKDASSQPESTPSSVATAVAALPPLDTAGADALWQLAPANAVMGAVVMPGAGAKFHASFLEVIKVVEARPFGKKLVDKMRLDAANETVNPFDAASFKKIGIDLNLGAAMFMVKEDVSYAIAPVSDRAAFRKVTEGTVETIDGLEVDKHDDDFFCTQKERYVCASSVALLKDFDGKVSGDFAKRVAALPAMYRGDAEIVVDLSALEKQKELEPDSEFYDFFTTPGLGILALRIGNGAFTARGWLQATPKGVLEGAPSVPNTLAKSVAAEKPNALFGMRIPKAAWEAQLPAEDQVLPSGLSLQKDVLANLTGEFLAHTPSKDALSGTISIGIADPDPFKTLINMGCGMIGGFVKGIKVKPGDGTCDAVVDVAKLPLPDPSIAAMFPEPVEIAVAVKSDRVAIRIGKDGALRKDATVGTLGKDLIDNQWNFTMWSEGISLAKDNAIKWDSLGMVPPDALEGIKLGVWVISHVYELGMAVAIRSDGVHGVMQVGTYAGDPPEAYAAYQAAAAMSLEGGDASAAYADLAKKWPGTMAGHQGGAGGSVLVAGITGMLAAVAIPSFVKYQERSVDAQVQMEAAEAEMEATMKSMQATEAEMLESTKPKGKKAKNK